MRKFIVTILTCLIILSVTTGYAESNMPKKKWTMMVFLNGNNNLDRFGTRNLIDMEKVGSNEEINIVVQWASLEKGKVVRMLIEKSHDHTRVSSPVVEDLGAVDMGSAKELEKFIQWTVEHYPAEHYFIDVWNHGRGWKLRSQPGEAKDISFDDLTGNKITTEQLGEVMASAASFMGHKVDVYASDACLMGMVEVADQMADSVQYFAGSQEVIPGAGWPYEAFFREWQAIKNPSSVDVVKALTKTYVEAYDGVSFWDVTFSAYDLSKIEKLNYAIKKLGLKIALASGAQRFDIMSSAYHAQSFTYDDYVDLVDFVNLLSANNIVVDEALVNEINQAMNEFVVANGVTKGYRNAHGVSIWLPVRYSDFVHLKDRYSHLIFNQHTAWYDALKFLLQ